MLHSRSLLVIPSKYSSVYLTSLNSLTIPSPYPFPSPSNHKIVLYVCESRSEVKERPFQAAGMEREQRPGDPSKLHGRGGHGAGRVCRGQVTRGLDC